VIGNNDVVVDDNVPCDSKKIESYYGGLYDIWFGKGDKKRPEADLVDRSTFMKWGSYAADLPNSDITVISFNSLYYSKKNRCGQEEGKKLMNWLREQLKRNRKFVINMHIFPGYSYLFGGFQQFWHEKDQREFGSLMGMH